MYKLCLISRHNIYFLEIVIGNADMMLDSRFVVFHRKPVLADTVMCVDIYCGIISILYCGKNYVFLEK